MEKDDDALEVLSSVEELHNSFDIMEDNLKQMAKNYLFIQFHLVKKTREFSDFNEQTECK